MLRIHQTLSVFPGPRGYVPASKLARYNHVSMIQPPPSPLLSATSNGPGTRRHSYTPGIQPNITMTTPCFQVTNTDTAMGIKWQVMNASQILRRNCVSEELKRLIAMLLCLESINHEDTHIHWNSMPTLRNVSVSIANHSTERWRAQKWAAWPQQPC